MKNFIQKLNKNENKNVRVAAHGDPKGITLISLVITIVVLIILAGVAINLTLGENGIFTRAETAKLKYEIGKAEEELDLKIAKLQIEKQGSATLQDLVDVLKNEEDMDYIVSLEEIASITGVETIGDANEIYVVYKIYQFRIDDRLQTEFISIVESYTADVQISSTLKNYNGKNEDEKYLATYEIKVESQGQVESIEIETIDGKVTETPTSLPYTKEIQVEIGQKYIVKVTTPDGKYKRYVIEEKAEETIKTAQELATFRDKVNSGLTYEGKTVKLANDIDLSSVCYKVDGTTTNDISWEPIGTVDNPFKGKFNGNDKTVNNIYINNSNENQGLFGYIEKAKVENVIMGTGNMHGNVSVGAIVGWANNSTVEKCFNENTNIQGYRFIGGIVGRLEYGTINCCYNKAKVEADIPGGICGVMAEEAVINLCINSGEILATDLGSEWYGAGGIASYFGNALNAKIENCYNIGKITGSKYTGGIVAFGHGSGTDVINNCYTCGEMNGSGKYAIVGQGFNISGYPTFSLSNNYWLDSCGASSGSYSSGNTNATPVSTSDLQDLASTLGDAYIPDGKRKNENGEWVDNKDEDGNIIYINNGYPILKWQVEE